MVATYAKLHSGGIERASYYGVAEVVTASANVAKVLGLPADRNLTPEQTGHVLTGLRANGARVVGKNHRVKNRITSLDLTLSAPLSFSVAWGLAPTEEQRAALDGSFRRANQKTLDYVLPLLGVARVRSGEVGEVAALTFHHGTARPTEKGADPQRHAHNVVIHTCVLPSGRVVVPNHHVLGDGNVKKIGRLLHANLYSELRQLGVRVELDRATGFCRLPDVREDVLSEFGNRSRGSAGKPPRERRRHARATRRGRDGDAGPADWYARTGTHVEVVGAIDPLPAAPALVEAAQRAIKKPRPRQRRVIAEPTPNPTVRVGQMIELTKRVNARYDARSHGFFATAGTRATVLATDEKTLTLQRPDGKVGTIKWTSLAGKQGEVHFSLVKQRRRKVSDERSQLTARAEERARAVWNNARPVEVHGHLANKQVRAYNVRQDQYGNLLVPMYNSDGRIANVEMIRQPLERNGIADFAYAVLEQRVNFSDAVSTLMVAHSRTFGLPPDDIGLENRITQDLLRTIDRIENPPGRDRFFIRDAPVAGMRGQLGRPTEAQPILIARDYETAATLYELTGLPVMFSQTNQNLAEVARIARERYPASKIAIMADTNATITARAAADRVSNAAVLAPYFGNRAGVTWNDFLQQRGRSATRTELATVLRGEGIAIAAARTQLRAETMISVSQQAIVRQQQIAQQHREHNRGRSA